MGLYKYLRQTWNHPTKELDLISKERIIRWRREPSTLKIDYPTRLDRARSLGYKAKPGIFVVRQKILKGGSYHEKITGGRRSAHRHKTQALSKNQQQIAEERVAQAYSNCEILNSYYVGEDGKQIWYEAIVVDPTNPSIAADQHLKWIKESQHTGRVFRGLTSAGKRGRGMMGKGKGHEKIRPSIRANRGLGN